MELKLGCFFSNRQFVYVVASALSSITFKEKSNSGSETPVPMKQPLGASMLQILMCLCGVNLYLYSNTYIIHTRHLPLS